MKFETFLCSFLHWDVKGFLSKHIALIIKSRCFIGLENVVFAGVCPFFSLEILQAGAVNGLIIMYTVT